MVFNSIARIGVLSLYFNGLNAICELHQRCCCRPDGALDPLRISGRTPFFNATCQPNATRCREASAPGPRSHVLGSIAARLRSPRQPKGRKSFICQYRVRRTKGSTWKERQVVLGTLAFLTVAEARDRARRYKAQAAEGIDPVEEKKEAKKAEETKRKADSFTFAKLVDRYEAEYLTELKPSGVAQKMRL